ITTTTGSVRVCSVARYPRRVVYVLELAGCTYTSKLINRFVRASLALASNFAPQNQYVIAPPSPGYVVIYDVPLTRLPDWLLNGPSRAIKVEKKQPGGPLVARPELPKPLYLKVLRLVPLSAVVTRHHHRRLIGILNITLQRQDHRNDGLNIAGFCMRELIRNGIISSPAAEELLIEVAILNGYAAKDGLKAAQATIRSGLGLAP